MTNARSRTAASSAVPGCCPGPDSGGCPELDELRPGQLERRGNLHGEVALRSEPDLDDREAGRGPDRRGVAADLDRMLRLAGVAEQADQLVGEVVRRSTVIGVGGVGRAGAEIAPTVRQHAQ